MILTDVLGSTVVDAAGHTLGRVADARFKLDARATPARARLVGLIVSPRSAASFMGYERTGAARPAIIAHLLRWMHRGSFLVEWHDIARIDDRRVVLRADYERKAASLEVRGSARVASES
jgi:sporulation protein YlmC with PRC-barrel domain